MSYQTQPWGAPPPPPPMRQPWHTKTVWIIVLLIVFAPVGIFLLYRAGLWRIAVRHIVAGAAALWFVIIVVANAVADPEDKEKDKPTEPAAVTNTTPAAPTSSAPPSTAAPTTSAPPSTTAAPTTVTTAPEPTTPPPTTAAAPPAPIETQPPPPPATPPAPPPATRPAPPPPPTFRPEPDPTTAEPEPDSVYYKNCTAVRAAGADPIYAGQPGYGSHLDRDGDGVACE